MGRKPGTNICAPYGDRSGGCSMRIYIDEAGPFLPPQSPRSLFSLVLSLIIPSSIEQELFYEFLRLRDTWPNQSVEIKGSSLNESQAAQQSSGGNAGAGVHSFPGLAHFIQ